MEYDMEVSLKVLQTLSKMDKLMLIIHLDMQKLASRRNKRAMQRIRVNTIHFAKVAKEFREISMKEK
jgi:hypothetical protein